MIIGIIHKRNNVWMIIIYLTDSDPQKVCLLHLNKHVCYRFYKQTFQTKYFTPKIYIFFKTAMFKCTS